MAMVPDLDVVLKPLIYSDQLQKKFLKIAMPVTLFLIDLWFIVYESKKNFEPRFLVFALYSKFKIADELTNGLTNFISSA